MYKKKQNKKQLHRKQMRDIQTNFNLFLFFHRNKHRAWIGLTDLVDELTYRWSDFSISKFKPFCHKTVNDTSKDCGVLTSSSHPTLTKTKSKIEPRFGCIKVLECETGYPYVCQLKNPDCDQDTNRFKDYLVQVLTQVTEANKVCKGTCKAGTGLAPFFNHKTPLIGSGKVRKVRKGRGKGKGNGKKKGGKKGGKGKSKKRAGKKGAGKSKADKIKGYTKSLKTKKKTILPGGSLSFGFL